MGFIFDLDGTLLDSMGIWDKVGSEFLNQRGIIPENGLDQKFQTFTFEEVAQYYKDIYLLPESTKEIVNAINNFIEDQYENNVPLKEGVIAFLEANQQKRMCIATASHRSLVEKVLKQHNLTNYFSAIFTCSEVGVGKTKPDIYEIALLHLGTKKEDTFVFEDALHGVKTAKIAGFPVVAVADQSALKDRDEIIQYADLFIEHFNAIFLEEWKKINE